MGMEVLLDSPKDTRYNGQWFAETFSMSQVIGMEDDEEWRILLEGPTNELYDHVWQMFLDYANVLLDDRLHEIRIDPETGKVYLYHSYELF